MHNVAAQHFRGKAHFTCDISLYLSTISSEKIGGGGWLRIEIVFLSLSTIKRILQSELEIFATIVKTLHRS